MKKKKNEYHDQINSKINKSAKIMCKKSHIGTFVEIGKNVEILANSLNIGNNVIIEDNVKIQSDIVNIGNNSVIKSNSEIKTIEKFEIGKRSDLAFCNIKARNVKIGDDFFSSVPPLKNLIIGGGNALNPNSNLIIGDRCVIHDVMINVAMPVKIGNGVGISHGTQFYTHYFWNSIFEGYSRKFEGIEIGDGCIIGAESFFLPGVKIGKNSSIGGRSVVTKSFPSSCVIAGNPAKIVGKNKDKPSQKKILELMKNILEEYVEILQTKGFKIKKNDNLGFDYLVKSNTIQRKICYMNNMKKSVNKQIILTFNDFKYDENSTVFNLTKRTLDGEENELTDDLRDFLRKTGVRIFTNRKFRSFSTVN